MNLSKLLIIVVAMTAGSAFAGVKIDYSIDSEKFEGYFSKSKGKSKGLVILIHDWDGLTEYEVKRAEMLADEGYDTFALDLYGKGNRPIEQDKKKTETGKLYDNRERMRSLILGGLAEAARHSKGSVVVMGYCFGGAATLELARSGKGDNIKGFASFHGGLKAPAGQKYSKSAPIFIAHGGADSGIPMTDVAALSQELEGLGVTYDIEIYSGAPHAFTVFDSPAYRQKADKKSWGAFLGFLSENLSR